VELPHATALAFWRIPARGPTRRGLGRRSGAGQGQGRRQGLRGPVSLDRLGPPHGSRQINGKGPYNFIVDTGAPLVYISVPVAKKIGLTAEPKSSATVERIEIEGGPVQTKFKCLVETPFQLEGMNALGLAGVELHGIIGYSLLARYKLEIDLTKDRMTWTKLDFVPPAPESIAKAGNMPEGLDAWAS